MFGGSSQLERDLFVCTYCFVLFVSRFETIALRSCHRNNNEIGDDNYIRVASNYLLDAQFSWRTGRKSCAEHFYLVASQF